MKNSFPRSIRQVNHGATVKRRRFLSAASARAQTGITEPDTIYYGQIINRTSGQADLITAGTIVWTVSCQSGQTVTLTNVLAPLNNGQYSYELLVPQEAFGYGLTIDSNSIPTAPAAGNLQSVANYASMACQLQSWPLALIFSWCRKPIAAPLIGWIWN